MSAWFDLRFQCLGVWLTKQLGRGARMGEIAWKVYNILREVEQNSDFCPHYKHFIDPCQTLLLTLSKFKQINWLLFSRSYWKNISLLMISGGIEVYWLAQIHLTLERQCSDNFLEIMFLNYFFIFFFIQVLLLYTFYKYLESYHMYISTHASV